MTDDAATSPPPARTRGDLVRTGLRGVGQTLVTAGLVVLLFVVYELKVTDVTSVRANRKLTEAIRHAWAQGDDPLLPLPGEATPSVHTGTGIAELYVPRFGRAYHRAVVEGVDQADLAVGPGHYPGTALPGQVGNFAVAGHRVGKGEPFLNLDRLRVGDAVVVETGSWWYVYRVKGSPAGGDPQSGPDADGIPGRQIVGPSTSQVLLPVPDHPGTAPTERLMTMTTCHPKFTAAQRMIVYAALDRRIRRSSDAMPAGVAGLYDGLVG